MALESGVSRFNIYQSALFTHSPLVNGLDLDRKIWQSQWDGGWTEIPCGHIPSAVPPRGSDQLTRSEISRSTLLEGYGPFKKREFVQKQLCSIITEKSAGW